MWTLQPLQASLSLLLIAVILVSFLLARHLWVRNNNVELHRLTNQEIIFSTYLKLEINTNLPATMMDDHIGNNNSFDSFATARDGLVFESEEDNYHDKDEFDEEEGKEDELGDIVTKELPSSPIQSYGIKYNRGKKASPPPHHHHPEPPKQQMFKTSSQKVKPRVISTVPTSQNSSIITSNQSNVTQAPTKKVY